MEAMVLSTIAGQLEDEEEETEEEVLDPVEEGACDECDDDGPFGGWALQFSVVVLPTAASRLVRMGALRTHPLPPLGLFLP